jgi:uncharacterized protein YicC (UPF0701 family)
MAYEETNESANAQIKALTDLVKSLLRAMEEQKEDHGNQLETLMKIFTQQIETLKAQVTEMMKKIETSSGPSEKQLRKRSVPGKGRTSGAALQ